MLLRLSSTKELVLTNVDEESLAHYRLCTRAYSAICLHEDEHSPSAGIFENNLQAILDELMELPDKTKETRTGIAPGLTISLRNSSEQALGRRSLPALNQANLRLLLFWSCLPLLQLTQLTSDLVRFACAGHISNTYTGIFNLLH